MAVLARDSTACSMPSSSSMSPVDRAELDLSRPLAVVLAVSIRCKGDEPGKREETDPL